MNYDFIKEGISMKTVMTILLCLFIYSLSVGKTVVLQNGNNKYDGAIDSWIGSFNPENITNYGDAEKLMTSYSEC